MISIISFELNTFVISCLILIILSTFGVLFLLYALILWCIINVYLIFLLVLVFIQTAINCWQIIGLVGPRTFGQYLILLIEKNVLLWETISKTALWLIWFTHTHVINFIHLFIWACWSISFLHVKSVLPVPFLLEKLLSFGNTRFIMTYLFNQLDLLFPLLFPTHNVICGLSWLQSFQHCFIIHHDSVEFFVANHFVQWTVLNWT